MKKLLIILTLAAIVSIAEAQTKQHKADKHDVNLPWHFSPATQLNIIKDTTLTFHASPIINYTSSFNFVILGTPIVTINLKKEGKIVGTSSDWDVMEIKFKKSQFHWLNDSTAIYIKP